MRHTGGVNRLLWCTNQINIHCSRPAVLLDRVMFVTHCIQSKYIQLCAENTAFPNVLLAEGEYQRGVEIIENQKLWFCIAHSIKMLVSRFAEGRPTEDHLGGQRRGH